MENVHEKRNAGVNSIFVWTKCPLLGHFQNLDVRTNVHKECSICNALIGAWTKMDIKTEKYTPLKEKNWKMPFLNLWVFYRYTSLFKFCPTSICETYFLSFLKSLKPLVLLYYIYYYIYIFILYISIFTWTLEDFRPQMEDLKGTFGRLQNTKKLCICPKQFWIFLLLTRNHS